MRIQKQGFLYQITFLTNIFPVNCYIVEEESELTLIDAALPYSHKGILKVADQIGKPVTRIVLTHAHDDHLGSLDKLKEKLPNAKIYISERDSKLLKGDKTLQSDEPQMPIKGGAPKGLKSRPDFFVQDREVVGSLQAVLAPGHTPGHMAFLDTRTNALIAGDAFQTRGGIAVAGKMNLLFPFPTFGTWNFKLSIKSAELLRNLQPSLLAVGHGDMLVNPIEEMSRSIIKAKETLRKKGK
ncbi:MBL fold metallo-hydrolase [Bacillus sp. CGMCC 1.16607]|uniref:MBL fold metallo-hydrolase n=1 Tax=Bacillus sp. CGMCC 1.16607 TaxID=3351842 RepID=UPI0036312053